MAISFVQAAIKIRVTFILNSIVTLKSQLLSPTLVFNMKCIDEAKWITGSNLIAPWSPYVIFCLDLFFYTKY